MYDDHKTIGLYKDEILKDKKKGIEIQEGQYLALYFKTTEMFDSFTLTGYSVQSNSTVFYFVKRIRKQRTQEEVDKFNDVSKDEKVESDEEYQEYLRSISMGEITITVTDNTNAIEIRLRPEDKFEKVRNDLLGRLNITKDKVQILNGAEEIKEDQDGKTIKELKLLHKSQLHYILLA